MRRASARPCERLLRRRIAQHPLLFQRLPPHDGRANRGPLSTAVGGDAASLRDASPAWSGQPPAGGFLPPLLFEIRGIGFAGSSIRQSFEFSPARDTELCTTPFIDRRAAVAARGSRQ